MSQGEWFCFGRLCFEDSCVFAAGGARSPEVTVASSVWLQTDVSNSLVCLRPASSDTVLVNKMFSLHSLGKDIESYTCAVYLCIRKDTSAFFILWINPSTTRHTKVNQGEFHTCVCWCRVVFCMIPSLTVSVFHCSLLDLYGYTFSPEWGVQWRACSVSGVRFGLPSKLLRASPTETPGMSVQTGLHSAFLSHRGEAGGQKAPLCTSRCWRGWLTAARWWSLDLDWLLTGMLMISSQQTLMSSAQVQCHNGLRFVGYLFLSCYKNF